MNEPFTDVKSIAQRLERSRADRDEAEEKLMEHVHALGDPHARSVLMKDAVYDVLRESRPFRWVSGLLKGWNR